MKATERTIEQGKALVRASAALEIIRPTGPVERVQVWFLLEAYHRPLRAVVRSAVGWLAEEMPSASERIGEDRLALFPIESYDPPW